MTDRAIDKIIARMSEDQKRAVRYAADEPNGDVMVARYRDGGQLARSLVAIDLAEYIRRGVRLTPLGLAVRAALRERG